ncbi:hypothetical protein [Neobacillus soli]|uniref:hypothetical protein n=1 Tax=Neobacillus soli TaxID=220688 RepID=UPI0008240E59|nr:hypothetical protein [Neobacillus soli]
MLKVRVKVRDKRFTVPVPYPVLNIVSTVITSKKFNRFVNQAIERDGRKFVVPQIERKDLKPLLKALVKHKGLTLVDTKLNDGTEVTVKL